MVKSRDALTIRSPYYPS